MTPTEEQVLRIIDKHDKLGTAGVVAELQKPFEEFGAELPAHKAQMIGAFLETKGETNEETLANVLQWFVQMQAVNSLARSLGEKRLRTTKARLDYIDKLENDFSGGGMSAMDRLLAMSKNADQSWHDGGRPANIACAIDDLMQGIGEIL